MENVENKQIWLSLARMGGEEQRFVQAAFDTNWVVPLGPNVNGFEADLTAFLGGHKPVAALSSGTAALYLALIQSGVGPGDEVICQSFTFAASANPIAYLGANPVFVDSEPETWNLSPTLLYGDLTIEKLKTDRYQSRTRNKLVAEAFYLTCDIEKYGSGFIRVRREIAEYPTMEFSYEESGDGFLVTVSYREQKVTTIPKNEGLNEGLNELLTLIRKNPGKRIPWLAAKIEVPEKTIERKIGELKKSCLVLYRGSKKTGGYWPITESSK